MLKLLNNNTDACNSKKISDGLDFILSHFQEPVFPRTISTYATSNKQFAVYDTNSILKCFKEANNIDCRINAYPFYTEYRGINRQPPSFIMCDFDLKDFDNSQKRLDNTLDKSLQKIKQDISGHPTVLWTGNGYHVYQPVDGFVLEETDVFSEFIDHRKKDLSTRFMRFSEEKFSNGKYDQNNRPSIKSCMIRVPGTMNSKCIDLETGGFTKDPHIKIIQRWDGNKPKINWLLRNFRRWLINEKFNDKLAEKKSSKYSKNSVANSSNVIEWIERLLQIPIDDYRKNTVALILAPYLVNIKKVSYDDAFSMIKEWLDKCNSVRKLDSNFNYKIKYALDNVIKNRYLPMKLDTLKIKKKSLYDILKPTSNKNT